MLPLYPVRIDFVTNEHYVLTPNPVLQATPMLFEPKQIQSATVPNTFTAQEAGYYSNVELTKFWNHFFTKQSNTTLKLLGKAICNDFWDTSKQPPTD